MDAIINDNMIGKEVKVVIIGTSFTSRLGIIRSIAPMECDISVVVMTGCKRSGALNKTKPIDCYSRYVNHIYYCHVKNEKGLVDILINQCAERNKKAILIPCSDFSASVIDRNINDLKDLFFFPHINHCQGEIVKWMNKERQKNLAKLVNLNVTHSCVIDISDKRYTIPIDIQYPCFTKPLVSIAGGKLFFKRCDNKTDLDNVLKGISAKEGSIKILVEDFIFIEKEYAVLGFSDGSDVVIPGVVYLSRMSQSHPGVALQGKILPIEGFEDVISKFRGYIKKIGFVGLFDIDFFFSKGNFYFGEMNLRFGGSGYAITKMGVNLPEMMVKSLSGESITYMQKEVKGSAFFVNERMCVDDWYKGYISNEEYHKIMQMVDFSFVEDEQDPFPGIILKKEYRKRRVLRMIKRSLKVLINNG